jgi:hypothetical protein
MKQKGKPRRHWQACALLTFLAPLPVVGCAVEAPPEVLTRLQVERITVPAALLSLPNEPAVPQSRMQSAAADYILRLKFNDDECHHDVASIALTQH